MAQTQMEKKVFNAEIAASALPMKDDTAHTLLNFRKTGAPVATPELKNEAKKIAVKFDLEPEKKKGVYKQIDDALTVDRVQSALNSNAEGKRFEYDPIKLMFEMHVANANYRKNQADKEQQSRLASSETSLKEHDLEAARKG